MAAIDIAISAASTFIPSLSFEIASCDTASAYALMEPIPPPPRPPPEAIGRNDKRENVISVVLRSFSERTPRRTTMDEFIQRWKIFSGALLTTCILPVFQKGPDSPSSYSTILGSVIILSFAMDRKWLDRQNCEQCSHRRKLFIPEVRRRTRSLRELLATQARFRFFGERLLLDSYDPHSFVWPSSRFSPHRRSSPPKKNPADEVHSTRSRRRRRLFISVDEESSQVWEFLSVHNPHLSDCQATHIEQCHHHHHLIVPPRLR